MLQRKRKTKAPCQECFLNQNLCICSLIQRIATRSKLSLIIHHRELKRTTNTGRLAIKILENSSMRIRGKDREPLDLSDLISPDYQSLLLFPSEDACELTKSYVQNFSKPIHLIVPDGNWRQASKVASRHPELKSIPRVMISTPNLAKEHLRAESSEAGMATLQAIAKAFQMIEGNDAYFALNSIYEAKLKQTLIGRGHRSK
jgi:DTW domain-containing protein YfiP